MPWKVKNKQISEKAMLNLVTGIYTVIIESKTKNTAMVSLIVTTEW